MQSNRQKKNSRPQTKNINTIPVNYKALRKLKISLGLIVAVFAFLLYSQSISFDYADDSVGIIKENKTIAQGISAIPSIIKSDSWEGSIWDIRGSYRPVSVVMFALEWYFFPGNPNVNHFVNVLLYSLSCFLIFFLLCKLFRDQNIIFAFICTLLFAAHPIHTEVVDNIKSRDEILCFLFAIISIFFFIKYYLSNSFLALFSGGLAFFISFLSKETGIIFLLIIPLMLFFFFKNNNARLFRIILVLLIFSFLFLYIRYQVLKTFESERAISHMNTTFYIAHYFLNREATAFYVLLRYIILLIFPHPLCFDYSYNQIKIQSFNDLPAIAGFVIYAFLLVYAFIKIRKKAILSFAILFFLIALVPVSNVFLVIGSTMAERFMYIPSLGFCMVIAYFIIRITNRSVNFRVENLQDFFKTNSTILIITLLITFAYSAKTFTRTGVWYDDVSLFGHDVKIAQNSARAHYQWARSLSRYQLPKETDPERQKAIVDEAIKEYTSALNIDIDYYGFRLLADCYDFKRDIPDAIKYYEIALGFHNRDEITFYNELGYLYLRTDNLKRLWIFLILLSNIIHIIINPISIRV